MNQTKKEKIFLTTLKQNIFLALVLSVLLINKTQAQQNRDFFFQKLTTFNGLSSNYIQCIFRDSRGYLWIGTPNGLNRYDGRNIKVYHHEANNPHSLPRESIRQITEDKNGILWLGADFGLIEFNPLNEKFNLYRHEAGNSKSLCEDHIPVPFVDSRNNLWIGTGKGLQFFNPRLHSFESFQPATSGSKTKNSWTGWTGIFTEDKYHNIWCTCSKGLLRFDEFNRSMKLFPLQNKLNFTISNILIDHQGNFWVVLWSGGLYLFHPENGKFDLIDNLKFHKDNEFSNLSEWRDPAGNYWLAICTGHGLLLYNHDEKETILVHQMPEAIAVW